MTKAMKTSRVRKPRSAQEAEAPSAETPVLKTPGGKLGELVQLMRRPEGATIADMVALTGWKEHSVRGALAGTLKKKFGLPVVSAKTEGVRTYRISGDPV